MLDKLQISDFILFLDNVNREILAFWGLDILTITDSYTQGGN